MKIKISPFIGLLILSVYFAGMAACAQERSVENRDSIQAGKSTTHDCSQAERVVYKLADGDLQAIEPATRMTHCYDGGLASDFENSLGSLLIEHPDKILSAMHRNDWPAVMVRDVAASTPSDMVDRPCRQVEELEARLEALEKGSGAEKERQQAQKGIAEHLPEVKRHCTE